MSAGYDVAIVGGGIIGLATAMALVERQHRSVVVLEAEDGLARHQTGHNSGVIHAGLYYRPGSLKARLCNEGRELLFRFCDENDVPHARCGKLVVATEPRELPALERLLERGTANGLRDMQRLDASGIREREPAVAGIAGLWVQETGVTDYARVAAAYARRAIAGGAEVRTGFRVTAVHRDGATSVIESTAGEVSASFIVNCAGLQSDRIARLCGADPGVRIVPFRGEYFDVAPPADQLVRGLIYPVPDPALPFLGVHLHRSVHGHVEAGPNAVLAFAREGYRGAPWSARDMSEFVHYPGFWRMAAMHWRSGIAELRRSWSKRLFADAVRRLVPALETADLHPGGSGVRAQAVDRRGALLDDFHLVRDSRALHVLNAPSPAATASISIGRTISDVVAERMDGRSPGGRPVSAGHALL